MDSSYHNPSYGQRYGPFSPRSCPSPSPNLQSYSGNPNFYGGSDHGVYHQNHRHYPNRHDLPPPPPPPPPPPVVNQPPSCYPSQLPPQHIGYKSQQFTYDSPRVSMPSSSFSCAGSRDISQSAWVGYGGTRPDSWAAAAGSGRKYQLDYGHMSRDFSGDSVRFGLDSNSSFRDEFNRHGYVRGEFGTARMEENYQSRGQFRSGSDRISRVLGAGNRGSSSNVGYCHNQHGHAIRNSPSDGGARYQRWFVDSQAPNSGRALFSETDDYYHSEKQHYFDAGRRENSNGMNQIPRKKMQKKSVLLRLETPRSSQRGRENDRSRHPCQYNEKNCSPFRGKDQLVLPDRGAGLLEKQRGGTPVDLDVSFKSNVLVAKAKSAGVASDACLTPRSSKVRRVLVTDKGDKAPMSEGIAKGDIKPNVTYKGSGSDRRCKQPKSEVSVAGVEKKSDSYSNPAANVSEDEVKKDKSVKAVVSDSRVIITDMDLETSLDQDAAKADGSIRFAENVPSLFCEEPKESKDEVDGHRLSNSGQNVVDGDISIQKSHQDIVQEQKGTSSGVGEITFPHVMRKKTIMKKILKKTKFPPKILVTEPAKFENLSKNFEWRMSFTGTSSNGSQPCTDEASKYDDVSSTHLMKEANIDFEGRNTSASPLGSLGHREEELAKSSTDAAAILSTSEDAADQLPAKSTMSNTSSIEDDRKGIHRSGFSLFPDNDSFEDCPKDLFSSARDVKCGTSISEANGNTEHLANADDLTVATSDSTGSDSLDRTVASGTGRVSFVSSQCCENEISPSVKHVGGKESSESRPYSNAEETDVKLGDDAGEQACLDDVPSSRNFTRKGCPYMLSEDRIGGDMLDVQKNREGLSGEADFAKAMSSEVCMDFASMDSSEHNQHVNLKPHHPGDSGVACLDPLTDWAKVLDSDSKVSLCKDANAGPSEALLEREVLERVPSSCNIWPISPALVIDNGLATGGIDKSDSETISDSRCHPPLMPFLEGCKVLLESHLGFGSSDTMGSVGDSSKDDRLVKDNSRISSYSVPDNLPSPCYRSSLVPVNEQIQNATSANFGKSQDDVVDKESVRDENLDIDSQKEKLKHFSETSKCGTPEINVNTIAGDSMVPCHSFHRPPQPGIGHIQNGTPVAASGNESMNTQASEEKDQLLDAPQEQVMTFLGAVQQDSSLEHLPCSGQTSSLTDVESDEIPVSNYFALAGYPVVGSREKSNDDLMGNLPDTLSDVGSPECSLSVADTDTLDGEALRFTTCDEKISGTSCLASSDIPFSTSHVADVKHAFGHAIDRLVSVPFMDSNNKTKAMIYIGGKTQGRKNTSNYAVHKSYSHSPFQFSAKRNINPPIRITKPHTWHRKGDSSASHLAAGKPLQSGFSTQQKLPKTTLEDKGTYVRRGNSLLRKSSHGAMGRGSIRSCPSTDQLNCLAVDDDEALESDQRTDVNDSSIVRTGETDMTERLSVPPSDSVAKISRSIAISSGNYTLSTRRDSVINGFRESNADFIKAGEAEVPLSREDGLKSSESVNCTGFSLDCHRKETPANLASANPLKITYVKRKSNQLVAASDIHSADKNQIPPSDGYIKRRKNQLVRTSDSHVKLADPSPCDALNARAQAASKTISKRKFTSVFSNVAVMKPFKRSKFSLVWTINDTWSRKTGRVQMQYQKILPQLFPWKRVTYWRRLMNSSSVSRKGSFSTISQRLLLLRKRHTVYTRSNNGYSLRKSKVVGIGGSHLKWSKSIERNSKKVNEEATMAVAACAKRKREDYEGLGITGTKSKNRPARERIFRIGSVRYKMDPSRRTLQRISDDDSLYSGPPESEKGAKKSFIPKRLVIGNDEYVRVGNGNQLVRDPKKRTRVLANEKVRWSLHNARLRLAKKRKYCQFFTRFGKCNKDDGKCPYIHDPSKIAVCTKFLNGLCANPNCKLTHKVIPERMPDCSYFVQGLCNNEACPYRHVHVNQNAATCEGFLRGYCADGNECRKKHTYTCLIFEATGICLQGSKCKLHHPKKRSKAKKRKRPCEISQKNARGRYFGSLRRNLPESESVLLDGRASESAVFGGEAPDFISLDVSEDDAEEGNDTATEESVSRDNEALDLLHERIKPLRLMQKHTTTAIATASATATATATAT